jgi:mRNA interferase MazF
MPKPAPGEIWRVDLGLTAKVRPCLVMSDYPTEEELALVLVIPHRLQFTGTDGSFLAENRF